MMHRNPGEALCEQILTMKAERELLPALPELFAAELRAAVNMPAGPGRIVLLLDGLHELASPVTEIQDAATVLGDGWVRQLVHHLTDTPGLLTILAVRSANDWQKRFPFSRKRSTCSVFELDYLTEAQAEHFLLRRISKMKTLKAPLKPGLNRSRTAIIRYFWAFAPTSCGYRMPKGKTSIRANFESYPKLRKNDFTV